jgi:hypothetical protein
MTPSSDLQLAKSLISHCARNTTLLLKGMSLIFTEYKTSYLRKVYCKLIDQQLYNETIVMYCCIKIYLFLSVNYIH